MNPVLSACRSRALAIAEAAQQLDTALAAADQAEALTILDQARLLLKLDRLQVRLESLADSVAAEVDPRAVGEPADLPTAVLATGNRQ